MVNKRLLPFDKTALIGSIFVINFLLSEYEVVITISVQHNLRQSFIFSHCKWALRKSHNANFANMGGISSSNTSSRSNISAFAFVFLVLFIPRVGCTESKQELILNGTTFQNDLPAQIIVPILLGITIFGFTIQTLMMVYVFISVLFSSKTTLNILCTLFGTALLFSIRATTVPIIFQTVPFGWAPKFPTNLIHICTYVNLALVTLFSGISILSCSWFILFAGVTGRKMSGIIKDAKSGIEPMVIILMPIYNEEPDALFRAIESAIRSDYPPDRKHLFLAFDDESESALYLSLLRKLKVLSKDVSSEIAHKLESEQSIVKNRMKMIFPPRLEWIVEGVRVTVCRFAHAGKSPTQGKCFKIINEMYGNNSEMTENTFVLFIDSDIILHENSLHNFVVTLVKSPKIQGATGLITCRTSRKFNIYQYLQDSEYVDGQMFERTAECVMGAVTCLPGALTLIRLTALQKVAQKYFIEFDKRRSVDFHRYHLGEDRYMTYLLVELADHPYQVTFVPCAQCKTYAPDSFKNLLKQRRRWFLGGLTNDIYMITSPVMWWKTPLVVLFKLYFYSVKGVEWMFGVVIVSLIKSNNPYLLIIFVLLGCRFLLTCVNALLTKRYKIWFSNILLFLVVPFFNLAVLLYSIWTWNIRSWGGPRIEDHDGSEPQSLTSVITRVMRRKEEPIGKTRKSIHQIEDISCLIEKKSSIAIISSESGSMKVDNGNYVSVKKFVPFPYESEFLGGGEFDRSLSHGILSSWKSYGGLDNTEVYSSPLNILNPINEEYLFGNLSNHIKEKTSYFRLDVDYLAKFEELATLDQSIQRESSFNLRVSGRHLS